MIINFEGLFFSILASIYFNTRLIFNNQRSFRHLSKLRLIYIKATLHGYLTAYYNHEYSLFRYIWYII